MATSTRRFWLRPASVSFGSRPHDQHIVSDPRTGISQLAQRMRWGFTGSTSNDRPRDSPDVICSLLPASICPSPRISTARDQT